MMIFGAIGRAERNTARDFSNLFGQGARDTKLRNLQLKKLEEEEKQAKLAKKLARQQSRPKPSWW